ncbi:GtrA family protein [Glycomyces xiaoerkulensis]|uniref:GtrA family protein n=1 Tax=Glycomyces xiaoerkulensis TaxID=2038139 RepID=UPI000C2563FF|nr:GtrA family protein [Glycomyces xiaoerkulensis]
MPTSPQTPPRIRPGTPIARAWDLFRRHSGELFRFVGVGGTAYLIDIGLFNLCLLVLGWPDWISKTLATAIATTCAFLGNRHWTWRDRIGSAAAHRQYLLYFFFNGIGLLIALGCLWANNGLAQVWPEHFDNPLAKNIAANVVGVGIASAFRFYAYRTWVFRRRQEA